MPRAVVPRGDRKSDSRRRLSKQLAGFEKFIGVWEIETEWEGGGKLCAKNDYQVGMNGKFVEARTYAKNDHGKVYQRYLTIRRL